MSKRRHALSDESVRAATVLGSWASQGVLVPEEKVIEHFKNKSRRFKKSKIANVYIDDVGDGDIEMVE